MNQQFELPGSYKKWTYGLIIAGIVALLYGVIAYSPFAPVTHGEGHEGVNATPFLGVAFTKQRILSVDGKCSNVFYVCYYNGNGWFCCCFSQGVRSYYKCITYLF
ncbi:MAG: hypothetical protein WDM90_04850 [Ferruginibacter sp.]